MVWNELEPPLLAAETEDDVVKTFQITMPHWNEFPPLAALILRVVKDPQFPKRKRARVNFLANSLAGVGLVTPRSSRDICAKERKKRTALKLAPSILRYEFYIECSCSYKGHSKDHGCPKCGAKIEFPPTLGGHLF
jgi:hypothetical protein